MRINIDSDGVVYNMQHVLQRRARLRWPNRKFEDPTTWYLDKAWDLTKEEVNLMFSQEAAQHLFAFGEAIEGAVEAIHTLAAKGHELRIITHKHALGKHNWMAMQDTINWYRANGILDSVDIVFNRVNKTDYPADVIIDDHPGMKWVQPGGWNMLFAQPWNWEVNLAAIPERTTVDRYHGWAEILEVLL